MRTICLMFLDSLFNIWHRCDGGVFFSLLRFTFEFMSEFGEGCGCNDPQQESTSPMT